MNEPIRQPVPKVQKSAQLQQLEAALASAEVSLEWIKANCTSPSRAMALRNQTNIIEQYRRQIAELKGDESWLKI